MLGRCVMLEGWEARMLLNAPRFFIFASDPHRLTQTIILIFYLMIGPNSGWGSFARSLYFQLALTLGRLHLPPSLPAYLIV